MKVTVKMLNGAVKSVTQRDAKLLVAIGKATVYDTKDVKAGTYKTRMMVAEKPVVEAPVVEAPKVEPVVVEPVEPEEQPKKKKGRPKKEAE